MNAQSKDVYEIGEIDFVGNTIPNAWYKTITKFNGKPDMNAIVLLAEFVFWYRPTEIRDEKTGKITGYKQKFNGDLLQKSYRAIEEQFGLSKRAASYALDNLERLGCIERVFRTVTAKVSAPNCLTKYTKFNNVMFIKIFPERIKELTEIDNDKNVDSQEYNDYLRGFQDENTADNQCMNATKTDQNVCKKFYSTSQHKCIESDNNKTFGASLQKSSDKYINHNIEIIGKRNKEEEYAPEKFSKEKARDDNKDVEIGWFSEVQIALNKNFPIGQCVKTKRFMRKELKIIIEAFNGVKDTELFNKIIAVFHDNNFREYLRGQRMRMNLGLVLRTGCWRDYQLCTESDTPYSDGMWL